MYFVVECKKLSSGLYILRKLLFKIKIHTDKEEYTL